MARFDVAAFLKRWLGKEIKRWSSASRGQCIDLMRQYLYERFGDAYYGIPRVPYARDVYARADSRKWTRVKNTPSGIPPVGAIAVFNVGTYGHVSIVRAGSTTRVLKSGDENWSKPHRVSYEDHGYSSQGVIGWLVPK